jgi:hypothetical protein
MKSANLREAGIPNGKDVLQLEVEVRGYKGEEY